MAVAAAIAGRARVKAAAKRMLTIGVKLVKTEMRVRVCYFFLLIIRLLTTLKILVYLFMWNTLLDTTYTNEKLGAAARR